jgi:uncharacterized phosphosugar-binding protein
MAATDARPVPKKNTAYRLYFGIFSTTGALITGATALDSEVSKDAAAFADCTSEATEIGTSGIYYLDLTATEMNADAVVVQTKTSSANAVVVVTALYPQEEGDIVVTLGTTDTATVAAVKAKTDQLQFTVANMLNVNIQYMNDAVLLGNGTGGDLWRGS